MNATEAVFDNLVFTDTGFLPRYGVTATILLSVAYLIVFVIGVVGNIAVVVVVLKCTQMHTTTNRFIVNLAIADLLVNVLCLPFTLISNLLPDWILGVFFCKMVSYLQGVSVSASINTLMAISIERCIAISTPLSRTISQRHYRMAVTLIWTVAFTINVPWLFVFRLEQIVMNGTMGEVCVELWPSQASENAYFVLANLVICYLAPLSVIIVCYAIIWRTVANRSVLGDHICTRRHAALYKSKVKVIKMVFVVVVTFALSWLPLYTIFSFVKFSSDFMQNKEAQAVVILVLPFAQWLGASNSCINPILYVFMNRKFRMGFKTLLKRPWWTSSFQWDRSSNDILLNPLTRKKCYEKRNLQAKCRSSANLLRDHLPKDSLDDSVGNAM